jgi:hypothetical protein
MSRCCAKQVEAAGARTLLATRSAGGRLRDRSSRLTSAMRDDRDKQTSTPQSVFVRSRVRRSTHRATELLRAARRTTHRDLVNARWTCFSAHRSKVQVRQSMRSRSNKNARWIKN